MTSLTDLMRLDGKKAVVTGAAGHCGPVVAETLLELGADVLLSDHNPDKLADQANKLNVDLDRWFAADLTTEEGPDGLMKYSYSQMGPVDILVHCAALTGTGPGLRTGWAVPFPKQSYQAFDYSLKLGLLALFVMGQRMAAMKPAGGKANIIAFGSIYGSVAPNPSLYTGLNVAEGPAGYSATKGGIEQLTRHLASVLAPDIRVNCLVPGGLLRGQPEEFVKRYSERTPLARMGREEDLKGAVAFLASDLSEYVTGQVLHVDGGFTIW